MFNLHPLPTGSLVSRVLPLYRDAVGFICILSQLGHSLGESYTSAEMKSMSFSTPFHWAQRRLGCSNHPLISETLLTVLKNTMVQLPLILPLILSYKVTFSGLCGPFHWHQKLVSLCVFNEVQGTANFLSYLGLFKSISAASGSGQTQPSFLVLCSLVRKNRKTFWYFVFLHFCSFNQTYIDERRLLIYIHIHTYIYIYIYIYIYVCVCVCVCLRVYTCGEYLCFC